MSTFELIPYRLYLSQSKTWMHKIQASVKIYILFLFWVSIFTFSYYQLTIVVFSLIIISYTIQSNKDIVKTHFIQTVGMTIFTLLFSFSISQNYKYYLKTEQAQNINYKYKKDKQLSNTNSKHTNFLSGNQQKQLLFVTKPSLYFFITVYSIKLVMMTTAPEILAINVYKTKKFDRFFSSELLFIFLLSSHIVNNIIVKLEKVAQVISLRGNLNLYKHSERLFVLLFLVSKMFFTEITKESTEMSQALYTRNLNKENNNFLKVYEAKSQINDHLSLVIGTAYLIMIFLI
uniref:Cobalt transport protein n=1 Tax=Bangia fuscopurpurea TaxID=101920 RepID=A0A0F6VXH0_BANFU|nr:hypothetical protein 287 [Bangia fuscopurpurea]